MRDVEGKVAFITGGTSGIGLGIAQACVSAGMKVVITGLREDHMKEALAQLSDTGQANQVHAIRVDVTDRSGMEQSAAETVKRFGKVHVLINNAAVGDTVSLSDASYEDWDRQINVNLNGVFNGVKCFLPLIKAHGEGGQIVSTSSVFGLIVNRSMSVYSTTKVAVVGMMEVLRSELVDSNIGVSVLCPGPVVTNFSETFRHRPPKMVLSPSDQKIMERELIAMMQPLEVGRLTLRGIRNNDLYILTHPEFEQGIRDRNDALLASIPADLHPGEARLELERPILTNPIFAAERDRRRCV